MHATMEWQTGVGNIVQVAPFVPVQNVMECAMGVKSVDAPGLALCLSAPPMEAVSSFDEEGVELYNCDTIERQCRRLVKI